MVGELVGQESEVSFFLFGLQLQPVSLRIARRDGIKVEKVLLHSGGIIRGGESGQRTEFSHGTLIIDLWKVH